MFRASRRFRSIPSSTSAYTCIRRAHVSRLVKEGESVRTHVVRFKNAGLTNRRLATFLLYSTCLAGYLWYFGPEVEVEISEGEAEVPGGEGDFDDSEYADEDSFFIPLTWAKQLPRTYYKGSDPEWQEFVGVAKDPSRHKKIHTELADIVFQGSKNHPIISKQLGRDLKIGKYWLDINFPDGPPQEYARTGIEVGDDFIALSTQKITPEQQFRISRALWPSAAFGGLFASTKVIWAFQYQRIKQALGWESTPEPGSPEAKMQHMLQMIQAQQAKQVKLPGKTQADGGAGPTESATSKPQNTGVSAFPWYVKPPTAANSVEMPLAYHVFNSTLARNWLPKKMEPPRGTFVVQGLIQVKGNRAVMTFDVQAYYDPKANRFTVVNAQPRSMKKWSQAPRGGQ